MLDGERARMSVAELQELEEVKALIACGQRVGMLTYAKIATGTGELDLDEADVEGLYGLFERFDIDSTLALLSP